MLGTARMFPGHVGTIDHRAAVFSSEDALSDFVQSLSELEAGALYELLNKAHGCRVGAGELARWRRERGA